MNRSVRSTFTLVMGAVPFLVLAGCGSTDDAGTTAALTPIQGTSYVTIEPATTATTLTASDTTAPPGGSISGSAQTYIIVAGDSVYGIAKKFGIPVDELVTYNEWGSAQSAFLAIGDEIGIPAGAKVPSLEIESTADPVADPATAEGSVDPATVTTLGVGCTYVIVAGDNPSKVSSKFGISLDALQSANADSNVVQTFIVGETLKIPAGADCSAAG